MANKIQFRRDIGANWISANPILSEGEFGVELVTGLFKIGDGVRTWKTLPYSTGNGGVFDSALMTTIEDPISTAPGTMRLYASSIANRSFPKFVGPSGLSSSLQPLLARNKIGYWCPSGNVVTVPGILGYTPTTALGTVILRNVAVNNMFTRMRRLGYQSTAAVGNVCGSRVAVAQVTLADGNGLGGFFKVIRFGVSDPSIIMEARMFVGVTTNIGAMTNVEPSTLLNSIGVGSGSADNNLSIYYGGSVAQTPIDLGINFPCNTSNIDVYELSLFAPPNSTGINWEVTRLNTNHVAKGYIENISLGATLPNSNTLLTYHNCYRSNGTAAAIVGLDIMSDYIETDY